MTVGNSISLSPGLMPGPIRMLVVTGINTEGLSFNPKDEKTRCLKHR